MYIASTINPLTKSSEDIPVLLLCYKQTRRFIVRPKHYEDLVRVASEKLALDPGIVPLFHTSTLDICRGHSVEVDESAYQAMCAALDELTVVTDVRVMEQDHEHHEQVSDRDTPTPQAPPTPPSSKYEEDRKGKSVPRVEMAGEVEQKENAELSIEVLSEVKTPRVVKNVERTREAAPSRALNLFDDDVIVQEDTTKEEEAEEEAEEEEEGEEGEEEGEEEEKEVPDNWQANSTVSCMGGNTERKKNTSEEVEVISHPSPQKSPSKSTSRKSISVTVSTTLPPSSLSNNVVKPDPEARYQVIIRGPPNQEAEFKTRGKHLVKKVLAGACKTFKLDLARAHLIFEKVVNGKAEYFECPPDQTMARCEVETGRRYFIHMDEEADELQDE